MSEGHLGEGYVKGAYARERYVSEGICVRGT